MDWDDGILELTSSEWATVRLALFELSGNKHMRSEQRNAQALYERMQAASEPYGAPVFINGQWMTKE